MDAAAVSRQSGVVPVREDEGMTTGPSDSPAETSGRDNSVRRTPLTDLAAALAA